MNKTLSIICKIGAIICVFTWEMDFAIYFYVASLGLDIQQVREEINK